MPDVGEVLGEGREWNERDVRGSGKVRETNLMSEYMGGRESGLGGLDIDLEEVEDRLDEI